MSEQLLDSDFDPFSRSSSGTTLYDDLDPELQLLGEVSGFQQAFSDEALTKLVRREVLPILGRPSRKLQAFVEASWQHERMDDYLREKFEAARAGSLIGDDDHRLSIDAALRTIPIALTASTERVGATDSKIVAIAYRNDIRQGLQLAARGCVAARLLAGGRFEERLCSEPLRQLAVASGTPLKMTALSLLSILAYSDHLRGEECRIARQIITSARILATSSPALITLYCNRQAALKVEARDSFFQPLLVVWGTLGSARLTIPSRLHALSQRRDALIVEGETIDLTTLKPEQDD